MTDRDFAALWAAALATADRDTYVAEWATSSVFDPDPDLPAPDYDQIVARLDQIWSVAHMTVADIRKITGMTQDQFARRFCINRRTVESWESFRRCPDHIRLMMAEILGIIDRD